MLSFRHDYVLAKLGESRDVARVELSYDGGQSWNSLASYSGGGIYGTGPQAWQPSEWSQANWQAVQLDLTAYESAPELKLRFSLTADQHLSDKGWLLDDVVVHSATAPPPVYLPFITRGD